MRSNKITSDIRRGARFGTGVVPLVAYAILSAATDVYAADELQSRSPLSLAAVAFTFVAIAFTGWNLISRGVAATVLPWRTNPADAIIINISTAASWISTLYALKYLEPAVVNVTVVAISPIMMVLLGPILRKGSLVLASEMWASLCIFGFLAALAWDSISGHSGVGKIDLFHAVLGIALMLISGLGATVNVIYSKRLSDAKYDPQSILSIRFYLIIVVSWSIIAAQGNPRLGAVVFPAIVVALIGIGIPLYLIQLGVKYTEPITASLICTFSPIFAFVLQLPVQRITPSPLSLTCIVGITALVFIGTVERARQSKKQKFTAALTEGSHTTLTKESK
jgi:drug/metabolite transporter (DMT)-like permease